MMPDRQQRAGRERCWQEATTMIAKGLAGFALTAAACLGFAMLASGCGGNPPAPAASLETTPTSHGTPVADSVVADSFAPKPVVKKVVVDPILLIHTSAGDVKVQLYIQKAPQTVDNFLRNYVNRGYYDQTIFHHVDKNSMIAAGGFSPDLQAKPSRAPVFNEASNGLKNTRGALTMARDPEVAHSATSQFSSIWSITRASTLFPKPPTPSMATACSGKSSKAWTCSTRSPSGRLLPKVIFPRCRKKPW